MSSSQGSSGLQVSAAAITMIALLTGFAVIPSPSITSGQSATRAGASDDQDDSKESPAASTLPTVGGHDPRRPLQEFWETASDHAGEDFAEDLIQRRASIAPQFLIATIPDPIDSRFGYRFDAVMDDIQMAIESFGWNLDRYWLPWWPSGTQPGRRDSLKPLLDPDPSPEKDFALKFPFLKGVTLSGRYALSAEVDKLDKPGSKSPLHEREPGVLVFRKPREKGDTRTTQQMLIVFLVGERPTSGVHKAALGKAITAIDWFERKRPDPQVPSSKKVRFDIAGPYFTGSERSLSMVIKDWTDRRPGVLWKPNDVPKTPRILWDFKVRSGSSNKVNKPKFRTDSGDDGKGRVQVEFDGTLNYFDHVLNGLFRYLKELNGGYRLGKVALLTESDTEFGRVIEIDPKQSEELFGVKFTQMKFPFHISQVAIAYDQHRKADDSKVPPPVLSRPSSKLRIPFDETGSPRDIVPSLSPAMTAASDEFDTAKILETISLEDYRYVGIVATDTRDVIFLAGLIRDYCPDVQLFSPAGDLILGHPTYAPQLRGMIVASTYPMFSMAQRWDPPHEGDARRHLFMHEGDQGYYNATVSLLGQRMDEEVRQKDGASARELSHYFDYLYDYGQPFDEMDSLAAKPPPPEPGTNLPPIWFGIIGQHGIWPVAYNPSPRGSGADAGGDFIFRPRPGEVEQPIKQPGNHPGEAASEAKIRKWEAKVRKWVEQFIPLVPQFTWVWGTLVLLVCAAAWATLFIHWQAALRRSEPGGFADLFRPYVRGDRSKEFEKPVRISQEFVARGMLAALLIVHCYFVLRPGRLTLRHSPWRLFLLHPTYFWSYLPWGDKWNWIFGLVAIFLAATTAVALIGAIAIRVYLAGILELDPVKDSVRKRRLVVRSVLLIVLSLAVLGVGLGMDDHSATLQGSCVPWWAPILLIAVAGILTVFSLRSAPPEAIAGTAAKPQFWSPDLRVKLSLPLTVGLLALALGAYLDPPISVESLLVRALDAVILAGASWVISLVLGWEMPEVDLARKQKVAQDRLRRADEIEKERARVVRSAGEAERTAHETLNAAHKEHAQKAIKPVHGERAQKAIKAAHDKRAQAQRTLEAAQREKAQAQRALEAAQREKAQAQRALEAATSSVRQLGWKWTWNSVWAVLLIPPIAGLGILAVEVILTSPERPYDSLLFLERAVNVGNGVSPEVPVFLLGLAAGAWLLCQLRRFDLIARISHDRLVDPKGNHMKLSLDNASPFATAESRKDRLIALGGATRGLIAAFLPPILTSPGSLALLGLSVVFVLRLYERFVPTIDGLPYNRWMILAFSLLSVTVAVTLCRFLMIWARVRAFLREIALLPMQRAFDEVPKSLSQAFGPYLNALPPHLQTLEIPVRQWAWVANSFFETGAHGAVVRNEIAQRLFDERSRPTEAAKRDQMLDELAQAIRGPKKWETEEWAEPYRRPGDRILYKFEEELADPVKKTWLCGSEVRAGLQRGSAACLSVLFAYWASRSIHDGYGDPPNGTDQNGKHDPVTGDESGEARGRHERDGDGEGNRRTTAGLALIQAMSTTTPPPNRGPASPKAVESTSALVAVLPATEQPKPRLTLESRPITTQPATWSEPASRWFRQAEDLVALQMVDFLSECTIHLKNLVGYLAVCPFLLMLAATSYPFQPQRFLVVVIWILLIIVATSVIWVYIQMERDEILSRISKTKPNEIAFGASFLGRITAVLIPIAGVLLAQFPYVSDSIAQFLNPIIRVLK